MIAVDWQGILSKRERVLILEKARELESGFPSFLPLLEEGFFFSFRVLVDTQMDCYSYDSK